MLFEPLCGVPLLHSLLSDGVTKQPVPQYSSILFRSSLLPVTEHDTVCKRIVHFGKPPCVLYDYVRLSLCLVVTPVGVTSLLE